ncbi:MAG: DnaA/Hda family protein [Acidibacillus sp.]|uniref:Chromosomal replication initiator protein DnaA n=1 Tax=Sulfoacidibacillus ferrooxidans TaxID=2005001 RepID=A0A9X1V8E4_9BACL|nr:AFG1/ZapE family ATPase [Sulfoacidibacillus ferrooxidans]MCI0183164.1 Chromosomal replication initiator protein DnaA [Sulfoacidibacillus ferrooxidans]MCY0893126.1 DnaA/Hda family protein [Acidibacillus sp.]
MSLERLGGLLPKGAVKVQDHHNPNELRKLIPALQELHVSDDAITRSKPLLLDLIAQDKICNGCNGYDHCGKIGDAKGMQYHLDVYNEQIVAQTGYCEPFKDYLALSRAARYQTYSERTPYDLQLTFANFPKSQRMRKPNLFAAAQTFANQFRPGDNMSGLYIFGPAGVGKTHLLHAILNRLDDRKIPAIFVRVDALFDRLRSMIGEGKDIEPALEMFSTVPVLALDEIGQERPNEFTLEKLFRIVNQRFSAKLPTLYTSNFAPPNLYDRMPQDMVNFVDPLKSRVIGGSQVGYLDGSDYRIANAEILDV